MIIMLALDGEPINLRGIKVSPSMEIKTSDKSGNASSTTASEDGTKAKKLQVSGLIRFRDKKDLSRLFTLAEAKGAGGGAKRYRIASPVAQAINMREGIFTDSISATEQDQQLAWAVTFTLTEQVSTAEKAQGRGPAGTKPTTTNTQTATGAKPGAPGDEPEELTSFEKILKGVDAKLGSWGVGGEEPKE
ncbi:baseplate complex protein [Buttiauxella brennerae]|uniref:baseplate complex protein n=1 Tax=Buttiauxella brennerae TaxID=82988 RepID=UPI00286F63F0|nr:hypothetical protein [Buttiauxella brennerae]